jgi:hypothetical protein
MRPIQFDVVGCVGDITHFDAEGRTEARLERLVAPIGRRYRQWADQRPIFEVAGARLQIQQRSADFKTMWRACRGDFGSLIDDPRRWRHRRSGQIVGILQLLCRGRFRMTHGRRRFGGFQVIDARAQCGVLLFQRIEPLQDLFFG